MTKFYIAGHGVLFKDNKILLLKRSKTTRFMPSKWDIPGGTVEVGETVEEAIIREFDEETSLKVSVIRPLFLHSNLLQLPERQTIQSIYLCNYMAGEVKLNPREHEDFIWAEIENLMGFDLIPFMEDFLRSTDYRSLLQV